MAKSNSKAATKRASGKKAQAVADQVVGTIAPALTQDQMERMEKVAASNAVGQGRRCALAACATSGDKLREMCQKDAAAFEEMFVAIDNFREHTKGLSEVAEAALTRMLVAYTGEAVPS